jgi:uncharacterized membrane protein
MKFIEHYIVLALIFVVIDSIWIAGIANKFYKTHMGKLLLDKPNFGPAVLFYALYILGIVYFVLDPSLAAHSWVYLLKHAALLGAIMYATYDLTNLATLKNWPVKVVVVDMLWGTFVTTAVSAAAFAFFR